MLGQNASVLQTYLMANAHPTGFVYATETVFTEMGFLHADVYIIKI